MDRQQAWYQGWPVVRSFPDHKGRPGQQGGSLPRSGVEAKSDADTALEQMMPAGNLEDLERRSGQGLYGAKDIAYQRYHVLSMLYYPEKRILLAGDGEHADIHARYTDAKDFDSYVKISIAHGTGRVYVYVDRVRARDKAARWDKAFRAAKVLRSVGFPKDTKVTIFNQLTSGEQAWLKLEDL